LEERLYALQDANWNVVALADMTGDIVERYRYSAYGVTTALTVEYSPLAEPQHRWEYLFTGRQFDAETMFGYYRDRYYHPILGLFVSADPIGYAGGSNWHGYVNNQPTVAVDPTGNAPSGEDSTNKQECCCCCAKKVWMDGIGSASTIAVKENQFWTHLEWENKRYAGQEKKRCTLQWWEQWLDYQGSREKTPSWYPDELFQEQWVDLAPAAAKKGGQFRSWKSCKFGDCPSSKPLSFKIYDTPNLHAKAGTETHVVRLFYIRLISSCPEGTCEHKAAAVCAIQEIRLDSFKVMTHTFHRVQCSPGAIGSFPPGTPGFPEDFGEGGVD
jgi:RHS repeat-associated protein